MGLATVPEWPLIGLLQNRLLIAYVEARCCSLVKNYRDKDKNTCHPRPEGSREGSAGWTHEPARDLRKTQHRLVVDLCSYTTTPATNTEQKAAEMHVICSVACDLLSCTASNA